MSKDVEVTPNYTPSAEKVVRYLYHADKYGLEALQKSAFETAARFQSDDLEKVELFWELPPVTTTSIFVRRLKLLENARKTTMTSLKERENECSLYHRDSCLGDRLCSKCLMNFGKRVARDIQELK